MRKREKERKLASLPYLIRSNFISSGEQERYQHFSFLSLEVSFGSLRERERETVDNFPEITRNRKKKKKKQDGNYKRNEAVTRICQWLRTSKT